jgi:hypothetical protein
MSTSDYGCPRVVAPVSERFAESYGRAETPAQLEPAMTQQEHESQRRLVELSLLLCPDGGRHLPKGHDGHERATSDHS